VKADAIERGEDREVLKATMAQLGIPVPQSATANTVEECEAIAQKIGYPVVIRPAYTMGGTGGGIAYNVEDLRVIALRGLTVSIARQVLIEEAVIGWEELELEVVRDAKNQKITVCFIENVDAMGVHTGDSDIRRSSKEASGYFIQNRRGHRCNRRHECSVRSRSEDGQGGRH